MKTRDWIMRWAEEQHFPHLVTPIGELPTRRDWQIQVMLLQSHQQTDLATWLRSLGRIPVIPTPVWREEWAKLPVRERVYRAASCLDWGEIESACHGKSATIGGTERFWEVACRRWDFDTLLVIWDEILPLVRKAALRELVGSGVK